MFSKILVKLIDQAVIPAILLIAVRIISVIVVAKYFSLDFAISGGGFVLNKTQDYVLLNSYSTLIMLMTLAVGILFILIKSYVFHDSHISPQLTAKVFSLKLSTFIQDSFDLYSQGSIWLSYLYLLMFVTALMAVFGLIQIWVFFVALILTVLSTIFLIFDIENELDLEANNRE